MNRSELRVVSKRIGGRVKVRSFATRAGAERYLRLFGPEPWTAFLKPSKSPDDQACCSGYQCVCGGLTYRQQAEAKRAELPALVYVRIEERSVGPWVA